MFDAFRKWFCKLPADIAGSLVIAVMFFFGILVGFVMGKI